MDIILSLKALRDLGPQQVGLFALYKLGLRLGVFRNQPKPITDHCSLITAFEIPSREPILSVLGAEGQRILIHEANEISAGRVHLFGGEAVELNLTPSAHLHHWADYESGRAHIEGDIKFIWEPARFGWATVLARAYYISGREKFAESFWNYFETFTSANPPYQGPNWVSAQEVALRIIAWTFCLPLLRESDSTTESRVRAMGEAIAHHAERIPSTLIYARSQNNNHLLSEAAGLITAASVLPNHPHAKRWMRLGKKWFNRGLEKQIDGYGEYSQHSTNYHRVMLQLALWVNILNTNYLDKDVNVVASERSPASEATPSTERGLLRRDVHPPRRNKTAMLLYKRFSFTPLARKNLARASHWLASMLDSESGGVPNLGANDGAYILPLTVCPFADYRPVVQASARAFLNYDLPGGVWDEMSLWFGLTRSGRSFEADHYLGDHLRGRESWAYLRTTSFTSRPGHADLLHLDLWWRGLNITRDAGTFSYNAAAPWDNPFTAARHHNTITVNDRDQMTRAGKFLYVDWANAYSRNEIDADESIVGKVESYHRAYRDPNITHRRTVTVDRDEQWVAFDRLYFEDFKFKGFTLPKPEDVHVFRLHWLFPDWKWEMYEAPFDETEAIAYDLRLLSPKGWIKIRLCADLFMYEMYPEKFSVGLVRAGNLIWGKTEALPTDGWYSPSYGMKSPALSFSMTAASSLMAEFSTIFYLPK